MLIAAPANLAQAQTSDRWIADDTTASAILPPPQGSGTVTGASLACAQNAWSLRLDTEAAANTSGGASLEIDGRSFDTEPHTASDHVALAVPHDAIVPLKAGLRLGVVFDGALAEALGAPVFSLRGSNVAVTAIEPYCSRPDMSGYAGVTFTPFSSYMRLVRELRAEDIAHFRHATTAEPLITAAMIELGGGRRLLMTRLCGSSWYFGLSGCNVTGFAVGPGGGEWRGVYDSEGVEIYLDRSMAVDGWPALVTLPLRASGELRTWGWTGEAYALRDDPS